MFINVNDETAINLQAVCNINVLKDKQILNMCYTFTNKNNVMSGYYYFDVNNTDYKKCPYFKENFIEVKGSNRQIFINKTKISFVKKESDKLVVGFMHSVLRHNSDEIVFCPEYMYIKMSQEQIEQNYKKILEICNKGV